MKPDCSKLWEAYRRLFDEDFAEAIKRAEERESTATKFEGHDNPWEDFKKMLQSENTDYLRKLPAVVLHNMPQNYQRVKNIVNEELKRRGEDPVP